MNFFEIYRAIRNIISRQPTIYKFLYKIIKRNNFIVNNKTQIVIEGFPKSGNSYLEAYFKVLNKKIIIAHHTHSIAQIKLGLKNNIPVIVLIREPLNVTRSMSASFKQKIGIKFIIKEYINFYKILQPIKKKIIIIEFKKLKKLKKIILILNKNLIYFQILRKIIMKKK